jgi:dihydroorotate dehydrogenase (NAD+) catalytic subunit
MDLSAKIKNLEINPAIMNGSGILSFLPVVYRFSDYLGAVIAKSIGYVERPGFETPVYVRVSKEVALNAMGLSGSGYKSFEMELEEYYPKFKSKSKPVGVSLFADSPEKLAEMIKYLEKYFDFVEINFSCPNLVKGEKIGVDIGRDPELVKRYVNAARNATEKVIIPKLSPGPYIDDNNERMRIRQLAKAAESEGADTISFMNTISGGMKIDIYAKRPVLAAKYGGMSGKGIMPVGVGGVYTLYESVDIPIIGVGGIENAEDIAQYVEAGASAVQIGTDLVEEELRTTTKEINEYLSNLVKNLEKLLQELNVNSLKELVGVSHV